MAGSKPEVTLTFAGDTAKLESAFDRVGAAAKGMEGDVRGAADGFDRAAEASDTVDTRAMGFRDTLTGVQDGFKGLKMATSGDLGFESLLLLGMGVGDLASGMTNFLVPALKSFATRLGLVSAATKVWTGVQAALNFVMAMNPIVLITLAVIALVAIIVLIATKTTWFQDIWRVVWTFVKDKAVEVWDWLKGLPDRIGSAFGRIADLISGPFRAAFNRVSDAWNGTIGRLSWSVPGWVPGIGGNSISAPKLPRFHSGGTVPGQPGSEMLAILQAGEKITPAGSSGPSVLEVRSDGTPLGDALVEILSGAVRIRGGDVQLVLGESRG